MLFQQQLKRQTPHKKKDRMPAAAAIETPIEYLAGLTASELDAELADRVRAIPTQRWLAAFAAQSSLFVRCRLDPAEDKRVLSAAIVALVNAACRPAANAQAIAADIAAISFNNSNNQKLLMSAVLFLAAGNGWSALMERWLDNPWISAAFQAVAVGVLREFDVALGVACSAGHLGCVRAMLRHGASPESPCAPLSLAAERNQVKVVQYMLDHCQLLENTKFQALACGNRVGALDCVRVLVDRVDLQNDDAGYDRWPLYAGNACSFIGYLIDTASDVDPACRDFLIRWASVNRSKSRPIWHADAR